MLADELDQLLAEAGASGPVRDRAGAARSAWSGSALGELTRHPGQPRAQREHLGAAAGADHGVREQQRPLGVRRHRSTDVQQEHHPAWAAGRCTVPQQRGLAALPHHGAERSCGVDSPRRAGRSRRDGRVGPWTRNAAINRRARCRSASSRCARSAWRRISSSLAVAATLPVTGRSVGHRAARIDAGLTAMVRRGAAAGRRPGEDVATVGEVRRERRVVALDVLLARTRRQPPGPVDLRPADPAELVDRRGHAVHAVRRRGDAGADGARDRTRPRSRPGLARTAAVITVPCLAAGRDQLLEAAAAGPVRCPPGT